MLNEESGTVIETVRTLLEWICSLLDKLGDVHEQLKYAAGGLVDVEA